MQVVYITLNFLGATIKDKKIKKVKFIFIAYYNSIDPKYYHYKIRKHRDTFLIT